MFSAADSLRAACLRIVASGELEAKLAPLAEADSPASPPVRCLRPARGEGLAMGPGASPLPRPEVLSDPAMRALALARFAHHELQAVELCAAALLRWPTLPTPLRRGLAAVLADEQRHARLYLARLAALGFRFEAFAPHSDYFWKHAAAILEGEPSAFFAALGLTLEQANLDFSGAYRDAFAAAGDAESAAVCARVHDDEIGHVALAARALRELGVPGAGDTQRYEAAAPFPFSAARAKGRRFDADARRAAGLDAAFVAHVRSARSPQEHTPRAGPRLLANLGAEEGAAATRALAAPGPRALAALWRALFDEPRAFAWLPSAGLVAWLNTDAAEARARELGLTLFGAPAQVVRRVHDKAFAWRCALEAGLMPPALRALVAVLEPGELTAPDAAREISARVATWPAWARRSFVLKPRLGTSGRGRAIGGDAHDARWQRALPRLAERGGALLEPWLERRFDASVQLFIAPSGEVELLGSLAQHVTPAGAPRGHRGLLGADGVSSSGLREDVELRAAALVVARAAASAGYWGPCGVDAFGYRDPESGSELLRPVVELNARFTLGSVALGHARRALAARPALGAAEQLELAFCLDEPALALLPGAESVTLGAGRASLALARVSAPRTPRTTDAR